MLFFSLSSWKKRHLLSIKSMLLLLKDTLIFLLYNLECDNKIINDGSPQKKKKKKSTPKKKKKKKKKKK